MAPMATPTAIPKSTAAAGWSCGVQIVTMELASAPAPVASVIAQAAPIAAQPMIEPTERSMPPVRITNSCPSATMATSATWRVTCERLTALRKFGAMAAMTTTMMARASRIADSLLRRRATRSPRPRVDVVASMVARCLVPRGRGWAAAGTPPPSPGAAPLLPGELLLHLFHVGADVGLVDDQHARVGDLGQRLALAGVEERLDREPAHLEGLLDQAEGDGAVLDPL